MIFTHFFSSCFSTGYFQDKSLSELVKLEADIRKKIDSGSSTMDISYWEDIFGK